MKKMLLAFIFLFIGFSYAQEQNSVFIEKGRWGLGGRFSLASIDSKFEKENFSAVLII